MIALTDNTKTILGKTVTQIIQINPVPKNLEEIAPEGTLGGWVESLDSIDPTSWINENIVLFKEGHISKHNIITSPYPETVINVLDSQPFTIFTIKSKNQFFNNIIDINNPNPELPDKTANQYKLKYFAFDSYGDPIDPCTREKIQDPIYEALKKRDKNSRKAPLAKHSSFIKHKPKERTDKPNFIKKHLNNLSSNTRVERIKLALMLIGLLSIINVIIRFLFK